LAVTRGIYARARKEDPMRAFDCDQGHDKMTITAANDEELLQKAKEHAAQHHPEVTEDQLKSMIAEVAYDA
jgi:N-acetyl-anhydromuramyl-L-alanine amidase AmpD